MSYDQHLVEVIPEFIVTQREIKFLEMIHLSYNYSIVLCFHPLRDNTRRFGLRVHYHAEKL